MNIIKKNIKLILLFLITIFITTLMFSWIYYLFGFSKSLFPKILFILNLIIIYIFNINIGKNKKEENIYNNLEFSIFIISIFFILSIIFFIKDFSFQNILYYIIIFTTSVLGILIGRRKKKASN